MCGIKQGIRRGKEFVVVWNLSVFLGFWRQSSAWDPSTVSRKREDFQEFQTLRQAGAAPRAEQIHPNPSVTAQGLGWKRKMLAWKGNS